MDECPFPTFHNLTHIELIFYCQWSEKWAIQVLQHCPKIQNLIFAQVILKSFISLVPHIYFNYLSKNVLPIVDRLTRMER